MLVFVIHFTFDRLTDVRSFTGTHRQRFDNKNGLGLAGRERTELDLDDLRQLRFRYEACLHRKRSGISSSSVPLHGLVVVVG